MQRNSQKNSKSFMLN